MIYVTYTVELCSWHTVTVRPVITASQSSKKTSPLSTHMLSIFLNIHISGKLCIYIYISVVRYTRLVWDRFTETAYSAKQLEERQGTCLEFIVVQVHSLTKLKHFERTKSDRDKIKERLLQRRLGELKRWKTEEMDWAEKSCGGDQLRWI